MALPIPRLHHVTATVDDAQADLDFCRAALGLRLVKRTVNCDNHSVVHFYYGDATGTPGTLWTTFPYRGWGVPPGTIGAGQVTATAFSVPAGSLDEWAGELAARGLTAVAAERFGASVLSVRDPSGLAMELVEGPGDDRTPWTGGPRPAAAAIRGLHSVTLSVRTAEGTLRFLADVLGADVIAQDGRRHRAHLAAGARPGAFVDVVEDVDGPSGRNGLGTVHHVAFQVDDEAAQLALREQLLTLGYTPTEVRDRCYFRSIYVRVPGGVLFEFATPAPGFTVDEPAATLGEGLKLPPWEEAHRAVIEQGLPPITLR